MSAKQVKLCWWCKDCYFSQADPGYSEWTPGSEAELICNKQHWEMDFFNNNLIDLANNMSKAETCPDWNPIDEFKAGA